jgi:hypothetical protein
MIEICTLKTVNSANYSHFAHWKIDKIISLKLADLAVKRLFRVDSLKNNDSKLKHFLKMILIIFKINLSSIVTIK